MRFRVLLIALISAALAQQEDAPRSARAPQGQLRYTDPNGLKVNWRLFSPDTQWRSQLEHSQRSQRAESPQATQPHQSAHGQTQAHLVRAQSPATTPTVSSQQYYKPFAAAPPQVKQLILQNYGQQRPYVDESAFLYTSNFAAPQQYDHQPATAETSHYEQPSGRSYPLSYPSEEQQKFQARRDYDDGRLRGRIEYTDEQDQQEQQQEQQVQHITIPIETMPIPPPPKLVLDKNMPSEIHQLLQYQAQIPYDVIANRINYKPKKIFIPKPLSDDVKGPYYYRSKVYYVKNENIEPEYETSKPVEEDQRH